MKSLKRVVILGFPNVGKSTLFNRLSGKRQALIHNEPGMTRDCLESRVVIQGRNLVLVDTGGLFGVPGEPLGARVSERALNEVKKADLVLFVLDARRGVSSGEEGSLLEVRRLGVPLILVVNKVDSPEIEAQTSGFYRLGVGRTIFVSAEHKHNISLLEEAIISMLPGSRPAAGPEEEENKEDEALRIAIVGRINVGKSSLINRLLGQEKLLVSEIPGTTRDSTDTRVVRNGRPYCLVDTAGIRKMSGADDSREKAGIIRAKNNIRRADVVCLVLDALEFPTRQDARIAQLASDSGKALIIVLNKWDLVRKEAAEPDKVKEIIFRRLNFVSYAPVLFVSALTGQRVVKILDLAEIVHLNATRRVETSKLNAFLEEITAAHPPRLENGGRARLRYITQKGANPPAFIVFSGGAGRLARSYERFLLESLRQRFGLFGAPLRLIVRTK